MNTWNDHDLPLLGVTWRRFSTLSEAKRFAAWAERTTRHHEYPCEAFISEEPTYDPEERFEVKARNW